MDDAVFRGMPVDAAPLRLRRGLAATSVTEEEAARARAELACREAISAGFDEGFRQGRQEGRLAGHEEGLRSGREEAQRHAAEEVEGATKALTDERCRLQEIVRACGELLAQVSSYVEDEMVALCYEAICRIVGDVALAPDSVRAALARAIARAREQPRVLLLVHPADAALIERLEPPGLAEHALAWRGDPSVAFGGCIVKSNSGGLDLRLETLLAGCKAALLNARAARLEQGAAAREESQ